MNINVQNPARVGCDILDPMIDFASRFRAAVAEFNTKQGPGDDDNDRLAETTIDPVYDEVRQATPQPTSEAGAIEALRLATTSPLCEDETAQTKLAEAALAYFDGKRAACGSDAKLFSLISQWEDLWARTSVSHAERDPTNDELNVVGTRLADLEDAITELTPQTPAGAIAALHFYLTVRRYTTLPTDPDRVFVENAIGGAIRVFGGEAAEPKGPATIEPVSNLHEC